MKKILVTGGAGFIGSHTVVELHAAGFDPVIVDNLSNSSVSVLDGLQKITGKNFTFYQEDCNSEYALNSIFEKEGNIEGVIHFAADKAVGESVLFPLKYYRNNVGSLVTLLTAMQKYGVRDLVFSSSCTVYGEPDQLPVTELSPVKPANSPYGFTKQVCEQAITDFCAADKDFSAALLRYFNPIGAHPSALIGELPIGAPNNLVPFITQTAAGLRDQLTVYGNDYNTPDGTCIRDYIHVVDLAKAHVSSLNALFSSASQGATVLNVGTGKGNSVLEVIHTFEEVTGQKLNYKLGPKRPGDVEKVYADPARIKEILGWDARLTLADALRDAWKWQCSLR
ncbi:MAG: UDP-glucose 4-epimerase GalE [Bacteroidota bacterium]